MAAPAFKATALPTLSAQPLSCFQTPISGLGDGFNATAWKPRVIKTNIDHACDASREPETLNPGKPPSTLRRRRQTPPSPTREPRAHPRLLLGFHKATPRGDRLVARKLRTTALLPPKAERSTELPTDIGLDERRINIGHRCDAVWSCRRRASRAYTRQTDHETDYLTSVALLELASPASDWEPPGYNIP
ncbi:hypothetical protein Micbo1qcDRAFT_212427 [Microdochium bolleyi]|uniref:Uncharacterized protein n=1 Tax=Microdochium bolleyi TaxID=196109 RepID=A0A136IYL0_9PEZI|nr:hypothetical protein Micbo1qcDRAFT_212427 [Microdochium bolleyi]